MICPKCGNEIGKSDFCPYCGMKQSEMKRWLKTYRVHLTVIVGIIVLGGAAIAGIASMEPAQEAVGVNAQESWEAIAVSEDSSAPETSSAANNGGAEEDGEGSMAAIPQTETVSALLMAVPVEYMSLRQNPGIGDDVVKNLYLGQMMEWYGEEQQVNGQSFYKVKLRDTGEEGYVAAAYCTPVEYEYNPDLLKIVDASSEAYSYDEMAADLTMLQSTYGDVLKLYDIGTSLDGRSIYEVVLGNEAAPNQIMIQAGIHGREYIVCQLVMKMLEYYACYYDQGEFDGIPYSELFQKTAIRLIPMSNPDGVTISQFGEAGLRDPYYVQQMRECYLRDKDFFVHKENSNHDMYWYDGYNEEGFDRSVLGDIEEISYETYLGQWKANAAGVDLNKNFNAAWESIAGKTEPSYANFKGYYCESEPETQILEKLAAERSYDCYVSYHAMGQMIYYDVAGNTTSNSISAEILARLMADYNKYQLAPTTDSRFGVSMGGFSDWIQLSMNMPSVTVEVGKEPCPVPVKEFSSIFERNRETWAMLCNELFYK